MKLEIFSAEIAQKNYANRFAGRVCLKAVNIHRRLISLNIERLII